MDATVAYVHLFDVNSEFSQRSTPDWVLHLAAHDAGFEGMVSTDPAQLSQPEEAVAITATGMSVVTSKRRVDDPVVLWASLITYMPRCSDTSTNEDLPGDPPRSPPRRKPRRVRGRGW